MDPVSAGLVVQRPRTEVFRYLSDIANHAEFLDHLLVEWRLTREDTVGPGAGVRFRAKLRPNRFARADVTFTEVEAPFRIAFVGRGGKYDRTLVFGEIALREADAGRATEVEWTVETEPGMPSDRAMELVSRQRSLVKRGLKRGLKRLRRILEEDGPRGARATVAGGARKPASGFRMDPDLGGAGPGDGGARAHASAGSLD